MSEGAARQQNAVLVKKTAVHRIAGVDVFADGVIHESHRSNHWHLAATDICVVDHTADTAEVIGMRMGNHDSSDRSFA